MKLLRNSIILIFILALSLVLISCDDSDMVEVGGLKVVWNEGLKVIREFPSTEEIEGKWELKVDEISLLPTEDFDILSLYEPGETMYPYFDGKSVFRINITFTNLDYELQERDLRAGFVHGTAIFRDMRLNMGDLKNYLGEAVTIRPYPLKYMANYSMANNVLSFPVVEKGKSVKYEYTFVVDKTLKENSDFLVWYAFVRNEGVGNTIWYEMKF
ncbi:MAG: hypothetical protein GXZ11_05300 [Tissierellia bacterium]|nr:hypothetical protein [Tissierellia bacterium]